MTTAPPPAPPAQLAAQFEQHYRALQRMARSRLRSGSPITLLDTVGLLHESYMKLERQPPQSFENDAHFLSYTARVMRSLVVDHARARNAQRRGGDLLQATLNTDLADNLADNVGGLIDVDGALEQLAQADPRLAQVVDMRFFGGFTEDEIAQALGLSSRTVKRDWEKAKMMLQALLTD